MAGIFDYLDLDPKTVEAAQRLAEERAAPPSVDLAPLPPAPPATPLERSPEEMRELAKARYPGLAGVSERRNAGLPAYEKPLVDDATAGAAAKIGGAPFPWKDVGELDQGYAAERAKKPWELSESRNLARGGPVMDEPPLGHKEPFERDAEEAESAQAKERKLQRTQGLTDIAEGLGNIDFRGVGSMIKIDPQKPFKAEGLRSLAKRQEDEMTPAERATVEETSGVRFPEGTSWDNAIKYMPNIARLRQTERADEDRDESRDLRREQMGLVQDQRDIVNKRVPDKVVGELKEKKNTLDALDRIVKLKGKAGGETGPIVGRINNLLGKWGNTAPEVAALQAEVRGVLSAFGKTVSGAAIAEPEMRRLEQQLPQMINPGDTFDALLERFRTQTETDYDNTVSMYKTQGRDTSGFQRGGAEASSPGKYTVGQKVRDPQSGKTLTVKAINPDGSIEAE